MTRDELRGIINGISDEQLKKILDINSADIGKAKSGKEELSADLSAAREQICGFEKEVEELQKALGEAEKTKEELSMLQKSISEKEALDLAEKQEHDIMERFGKAAGEAKFLNDFTRNGIFGEFRTALNSPDFEGKTDAEVYEAIITGRENIFAPLESGIPMVVSVSGGLSQSLDDGDIREIMGLSRG